MKSFWALPALLRVAVAAKHSFSVTDDILAFPQFEIRYSPSFVLDSDAHALLSGTTHHIPSLNPDSTALQKQDPDTQWPFPHPSHPDDPEDATYETLSRGDRRFLCRVPRVAVGRRGDENATRAAASEREELERARTKGWELLADMQGRCMYYGAGWWTYRFCFGQGVKQFHQLQAMPGLARDPPVEDPNVEGYMLGQVEGGEEKGVEVRAGGGVEVVDGERQGLGVSAGVKYLFQRLEGGTVCDLTGRERRIEIQFHCSQSHDDHIELIKETTTCAYLMVIKTPKLCGDVAFLPPQRDDPNFISCAPILHPDQVPAYKANLAASPRPSIPNPFVSPPLPRVGNIQVGAHALIPEGKEIVKSNIVGGTAGETVVDVIASSGGGVSTAEELKKLGIAKPEYVEKLRTELDKIAGDQGWKLEVVDTPRGREYRGTIGDGGEGGAEGDKVIRHNPALQRGAEERAKYEKEKWDAERAVKKDGKQKVESEKGDEQEGEEQVGSVEEMQEEHETETEPEVREKADNKPNDDEGIRAKKKQIMEALMEREGAEELVMVWDDGDGELVVDRAARDEL